MAGGEEDYVYTSTGIFVPVVAKFNETGEDVVCNNWDLSTLRKEGRISLRIPQASPEIQR